MIILPPTTRNRPHGYPADRETDNRLLWSRRFSHHLTGVNRRTRGAVSARNEKRKTACTR